MIAGRPGVPAAVAAPPGLLPVVAGRVAVEASRATPTLRFGRPASGAAGAVRRPPPAADGFRSANVRIGEKRVLTAERYNVVR
ncbi:hypothetical protein ACFV8T_28420 [Streptomyces sp. NPDC059832]|uniref:hypothetical protein n=1 Tax=Streptomyces sp. NPDC059832 TaxID=3346966 RepID=UPI003665E3C7